jgi:hypothetical protein
MEDGNLKMEEAWRSEDGGWSLDVGGWRLWTKEKKLL